MRGAFMVLSMPCIDAGEVGYQDLAIDSLVRLAEEFPRWG